MLCDFYSAKHKTQPSNLSYWFVTDALAHSSLHETRTRLQMKRPVSLRAGLPFHEPGLVSKEFDDSFSIAEQYMIKNQMQCENILES